VDLASVERGMANVLIEPETTLASIIVHTKTKHLDVAPTNIELSAAEVELFSAIGREMALRDKLTKDIVERYDYVLIACPATLGLLTLNSLAGSNGDILPVQSQSCALKGV